MGGPEVSYDAEKFLTENSEFKGVMVGEGEETFKELAGHYVEKNPQNLKNMTGICYRDGDQIIHNGWRQIMDLSSIPFIYKDLSEFKNRSGTGTNIPDKDMKSAKPTRTHARRKSDSRHTAKTT